MKTFGSVIASARKELGISQKDLAALIRKEDGETISPQYLNDIEHDRRNPPSEFIIEQLAQHLKRTTEYLVTAAGILPSQMRQDLTGATPDQIARAYRAFRDSLKEK
jgi:transcriptional regulator with XRE-family HTH domain